MSVVAQEERIAYLEKNIYFFSTRHFVSDKEYNIFFKLQTIRKYAASHKNLLHNKLYR